jgi:hypothetical protein
MLEETHFRNRTKAFVGLLVYAMIILLAINFTPVPWVSIIFLTCVHILPSKSRCAHVIPWIIRFSRAVFAVGAIGVFAAAK